MVIHDNYLYTVDCDEGLRIFEITASHKLTPLGAFTPLGVAYDLAVFDGFAYIASGFNQGFIRFRWSILQYNIA
ncbi:MAG: hypothetical protein R2867_07295 [Caldilineaceae bacterium]